MQSVRLCVVHRKEEEYLGLTLFLNNNRNSDNTAIVVALLQLILGKAGLWGSPVHRALH
jgi:hypothetical protein